MGVCIETGRALNLSILVTSLSPQPLGPELHILEPNLSSSLSSTPDICLALPLSAFKLWQEGLMWCKASTLVTSSWPEGSAP